MTLTVYFPDGSEVKHSCDNWSIEDGVLHVLREGRSSTQYYYPLYFLKYFTINH